MQDKELLELAAKAAGYKVKQIYKGKPLSHYYNNAGDTTFWNPLADDGDALRLAVKLANTNDNFHSIIWNWTHRSVRVFADGIEGYGDDPYAATRRAIVRAAAEIGKGMK